MMGQQCSKKLKLKYAQAKQIFATIFSGIILLSIVSCGVKGDPQPPVEPVTLGRGHTDFKTKEEKLNEKRKAFLKKEDEK